MLRHLTPAWRVLLWALSLALVISTVSSIVAHVLCASAASDYRSRCALYAAALSSTNSAWLSRTDEGATSTYPFLSLGVHYMRAFHDGEEILDIRSTAFEDGDLPVPAPLPPFPSRTIRTHGRWVIDVAIPCAIATSEGSQDDGSQSGILQFGIEADELRLAVRRILAWIAIPSFLVWVCGSGIGGVAICRRSSTRDDDAASRQEMPDAARRIGAGDLLLYMDERRFEISGVSVEVTPKQARVLEVMLAEPGRAFCDKDFLQRVWDEAPYATSSDVKQQIYLIRKRLREAGLPADRIVMTVPGVGYKVSSPQIDAPCDAASTAERQG